MNVFTSGNEEVISYIPVDRTLMGSLLAIKKAKRRGIYFIATALCANGGCTAQPVGFLSSGAIVG